jgi:3-phenylpropionate/trans-cinnamate dioxygenase ferredoxin component
MGRSERRAERSEPTGIERMNTEMSRASARRSEQLSTGSRLTSEASEFVPVCTLDEIPVPGAKRVVVGTTPVSVVRSDGEVYAIHDVCSHANVSLSEGEVEDGTIECWLHGSRFDLRSGKPIGLPATKPVPVYTVKIEGDTVFVSLNQES